MEGKRKKKAILYARSSTKDDGTSGRYLWDQLSYLNSHPHIKNYEYVGEICEILDGCSSESGKLEELYNSLKPTSVCEYYLFVENYSVPRVPRRTLVITQYLFSTKSASAACFSLHDLAHVHSLLHKLSLRSSFALSAPRSPELSFVL